jgi:hypothetical protein
LIGSEPTVLPLNEGAARDSRKALKPLKLLTAAVNCRKLSASRPPLQVYCFECFGSNTGAGSRAGRKSGSGCAAGCGKGSVRHAGTPSPPGVPLANYF